MSDLAKDFKFTGGDDISHFLGYGITRDRQAKTLVLEQFAFVDALLKQYGMADQHTGKVTPARVPCRETTSGHIGINMCPPDGEQGEEERQFMKNKPFRAVVGSLMWLMRGSRPDLAFVCNKPTRVMHNPGRAHWDAAMHCLDYVAGTRTSAITYTQTLQGDILTCAVDADWLPRYGHEYDNYKSNTGWLFYYGNAAITWYSKKQATLATSTPEAECNAGFDAAKECVKLRHILEDMKIPQLKPTIMQEDNQAVIRMSLNSSEAERTEHWDFKIHYIRTCVQNFVLSFAYVSTKDQMADGNTK